MDHHADLMMIDACILKDAEMYPNVRESNPNGEPTNLCRKRGED